jgi:hypothetical protein
VTTYPLLGMCVYILADCFEQTQESVAELTVLMVGIIFEILESLRLYRSTTHTLVDPTDVLANKPKLSFYLPCKLYHPTVYLVYQTLRSVR